MKILVLSDTHIPRTTQTLPKQVYDEIANVDMIIHAGDFVEKDLYDQLASLRDIKAVCGNMDSQELRAKLPQKDILKIGAITIGLIHGHGSPRNLVDTVLGEFKGVNAIIFGHSHSTMNEVRDGVLLFNPGSPTDKIFAAANTYGIIEINGKKIEGQIIKVKDDLS